MNFYKRYPGDYARDTGHLSLAQHGAYTLLLDCYYSTGSIPKAERELFILCRAMTKADRIAVMRVVNEFFPDRRNHRADLELEKWNEKAANNREIGKLGGRPKANPDANPKITQTVSKNNPPRSQKSEEESKSGSAASGDDTRKQLFDIGKTILGANSGGLISKAIAETDEATVGAVLGEMALKPKADPRAYFAAATKTKERGLVA
jgi:uncharacterized protein YdaU (DUF1376 family)